MIRSRRVRSLCLAAFVLPVLLLRAAIPAGFMAAAVDGTLKIVLCQPGMMTGGHHHHTDPLDKTSADVDPTCPYAQSAGPTLMPSLPSLPAAVAMHRLQFSVSDLQHQFGSGPSRLQSARAPPTLA